MPNRRDRTGPRQRPLPPGTHRLAEGGSVSDISDASMTAVWVSIDQYGVVHLWMGMDVSIPSALRGQDKRDVTGKLWLGPTVS